MVSHCLLIHVEIGGFSEYLYSTIVVTRLTQIRRWGLQTKIPLAISCFRKLHFLWILGIHFVLHFVLHFSSSVEDSHHTNPITLLLYDLGEFLSSKLLYFVKVKEKRRVYVQAPIKILCFPLHNYLPVAFVMPSDFLGRIVCGIS